MIITLPFPPSGNHRLGKSNTGWYRTEEYRRYISQCRYRKKQVMPANIPLKVVATFHAPNHRRYDLDNAFKCVADALQVIGVIADDYFFFDVKLLRGDVDKTNPRVELEIEVIK